MYCYRLGIKQITVSMINCNGDKTIKLYLTAKDQFRIVFLVFIAIEKL